MAITTNFFFITININYFKLFRFQFEILKILTC